MQIDYDLQAGALYIRFREGEVDDTLSISPYIYADVDADGVPVGLEILFAQKALATNDLMQVVVNIDRAPASPSVPVS